jgi:hypothetical protein
MGVGISNVSDDGDGSLLYLFLIVLPVDWKQLFSAGSCGLLDSFGVSGNRVQTEL